MYQLDKQTPVLTGTNTRTLAVRYGALLLVVTETQDANQRGTRHAKSETKAYSRGNPVDLLEPLHHLPVQKDKQKQ